MINTREPGRTPLGGQTARSPARAGDARVTTVQDAPAQISFRSNAPISPGAGLGFALNKVRVVFRFRTSVSVEVN